MDETLKMIGSLLPDTAQRDAVHIAVAPAVAGERLHAGQHVALIDGKAYWDGHEEPAFKTVGIVDPFLKVVVKKGERFFIFLFPGSITSLRHEWTHPEFDVAPLTQNDQERSAQRENDTAWIMTFADAIGLSYNKVMSAAEARVLDDNYYYTFHGEDTPDECYTMAEEFWIRFERLRGLSPKSRSNFFSCSC